MPSNVEPGVSRPAIDVVLSVVAPIVRAAVTAAATGAAAYGVRKLRSNRDEVDEKDAAEGETSPDVDQETGDGAGKRQDLTQTLATKVAGAKRATSRLKPSSAGHRSIVDSAWDAASEQLLPVAQEAAAALGAKVAKKAPDMIRDELIPRFIEGFQKAN